MLRRLMLMNRHFWFYAGKHRAHVCNYVCLWATSEVFGSRYLGIRMCTSKSVCTPVFSGTVES